MRAKPIIVAAVALFSLLNWVQTATAYAVYGAIGDTYARLSGQDGPLGAPSSDEADAPYGGRFNNFANGAIYWHPAVGAFAVWGDIFRKWNEFGRVDYGYPITDELGTPDGHGRFNHFRAIHLPGNPDASVYWTPETGAHAVYGAIRDKWAAMGWERGAVGYPTSDEGDAPYGGRFNNFAGGAIYWHPTVGPFAMWGDIFGKWNELGGVNYGYPITDELGTPDGRGRFNHFRAMHLPGNPDASVYWTPQTGAHAVYGAIRDQWAAMGWERSALGYPTSDEYQDGQYRRSNFEGGSIRWSPQGGAEVIPAGSPQIVLRAIEDAGLFVEVTGDGFSPSGRVHLGYGYGTGGAPATTAFGELDAACDPSGHFVQRFRVNYPTVGFVQVEATDQNTQRKASARL